MSPTKCLLFILCLFSCAGFAQQNRKKDWPNNLHPAQADTLGKDSSNHEGPSFTLGADYTSQVTFWGRDFGQKQFGISPYALLESGKGFYAYAINDYRSATPHKPARTIFGIGYDNQLTDNLYVFAGYEHWFNHYGNHYLNHALQNEIEAGLSYDLKWFTIEPVFYFMFGLERMGQLDLTLEREIPLFSVGHKANLSIKPQALASLAPPLFAYIYYEFPAPDYDYEKFRLVDTEGNVSISLEAGNFEGVATAHYNIPFKAGNETVSPFYYFTIELSYTF